MSLDGHPIALLSEELGVLTDLANKLQADPTTQDKALAAARDKVQGQGARYVLAIYELEIGRQRKDDGLRAEALDVLIASKLTPAERLASYLGVRGFIAFQQRDFSRAGALWSRQLQLKPGDANVLANLAQVRQAQGDAAGSVDLLPRAAAARAASGEKPSEDLSQLLLSSAYNGHLVKPTVEAALALVGAYPSQDNWRLSLVAYRQLVAPSGEFEIDLLRLMRFTGSLTRAEEYQRLAQLLEHSGRSAEAKAVLEDGISRRLLNPGQSPIREILAEIDRFIPQERARLGTAGGRGFATASPAQALAVADSLVGAGRVEDGVALYRSLLARPDIDRAQVNTHLGMALMAAGRDAEAVSSFRAAAAESGAGADQAARYADLAAFWLTRLTQPASAIATVRR